MENSQTRVPFVQAGFYDFYASIKDYQSHRKYGGMNQNRKTDPHNWHHTWPKFQVPVYRLAIQNGMFIAAVAIAINARL